MLHIKETVLSTKLFLYFFSIACINVHVCCTICVFFHRADGDLAEYAFYIKITVHVESQQQQSERKKHTKIANTKTVYISKINELNIPDAIA